MDLKKICLYVGLISLTILLIELYTATPKSGEPIPPLAIIGMVGTGLGLGLYGVLDNVDKDFD